MKYYIVEGFGNGGMPFGIFADLESARRRLAEVEAEWMAKYKCRGKFRIVELVK